MSDRSIEQIKREAKRLGTDPQGLFAGLLDSLKKGDFQQARMKGRLALIYDPRLAAKIALSYEHILDEHPDNVNARLSLADLHLYLGEVEGAISELEEILDIVPDRPDVYNMLGKLYLKQGDYDSSITLLESAIKSDIRNTSLVEMLAGSYVERDRIKEAITLYKDLIAVDPNNRNYLRVLGELETRVGSYEDAANRFFSMLNMDSSSASEVIFKLEDLKKKAPQNITIKEILAETYIKAVKPTLAVAELESLLAADPSLGDRVIAKYKDILGKYPDEPFTIKALAKALTDKQVYSEAVAELRKLMKYGDQYMGDAIAGFKNVISRFPGQVHAHESLGDAYLKLARTEDALQEYLEVMKLDGSNVKQIIEKCVKISKDNQNMLLVHQVLGQAYVLAGEGALAIQEAEFCIYLDRNFAPAYQIMGDAFMRMSNPLKAQGSYVTAMNLDPFNVILHGRYEKASHAVLMTDIANLNRKIEDDPWRLGTHLDIAKLYLMVRDFDRAVKELQTAVKDTARAPFAYNLLGQTFIELGRFDLAASQFERSLEAIPKELMDVSKTVRMNLGAAYEAMGNVAGAIAQYESVLSEDVEFGGLQSRVKNLAGLSQESQRNKYIALVMDRFGEKSLIGMWGEDLRHNESMSEILSISFGQEHNSLGFDHFIKGRFKGAMEEFSLASQLDPKFCAALSNLASIYMMEGKLEQAETRIRNALAIDPDSPVLHNNMGVLYYLKNELEPASAEFMKAIESDPNLSAAYINLGDVMYRKNSAQNALSMWEKVKMNDPLSPIALRRLSYKTVKA